MDFHGEKRKNETHESTTDPDARLFRKSKGSEAKSSYLGHVMMENRNGLLVQGVRCQRKQDFQQAVSCDRRNGRHGEHSLHDHTHKFFLTGAQQKILAFT